MIRDPYDALIDQLLREILGGDRPRDMTARVLAQARILDRFRRRNRWLGGLAAAAAIALAATLTLYWPHPYPAPLYDSVVVSSGVNHDAMIQTTETEGGTIKLGGYVDISLSPDTALKLGGTRYREKVFLDQGNLTVNVLKRRGEFDVVVGPATVHVTGTQFSVDVANEVTPTERQKKMIVSVREGNVQVQGVGEAGNVPVSLSAGEKKEFLLSTAPRLVPQLRAGAGLLAAAQEGARVGNRGAQANRVAEALATNRANGGATGNPSSNPPVVRPNPPVQTRPQSAASGPLPVRLLSTPGAQSRYGKLRRSGDLYYLETSDGNNFFMFQRAAVAGAHADWLVLPLDQSTRVAWAGGQVTSVIQAAATRP
jgi:hypothetical protein